MGYMKEHAMAVDEALSAVAHESGALDTCEYCDDTIWGGVDAESAGELAREKYAAGEYHHVFSSADEFAELAVKYASENGTDECHCDYVAGKDD